MRGIRNRDFEYYEEKAAYFQYTHESEYSDTGFSDAYLNLDARVIQAVQEKAKKDAVDGGKIDQKELENYIVKQGLVKQEDSLAVIGDLYDDYEIEFLVIRTERTAEDRKKRS